MSKYHAYPEYKDSGVEWLGDIPSKWKLCRLKFLAKIKNGQDYKSVEAEEGYPVIGSGGQFTYASQFTYNRESVLLGRKGTIDKPLYINEPFWTVDTMYYTEINGDVCPKYLYYLALTIQFGRYATNTALPSMTQEHLGNYFFAVPSGEIEKKIIANFLDHETAKIDTLIEKQQQLIQLLKEKRQAVISHAVTKGLSSLNGGPNAKMRDSGVEWLGEVPEHWVQIKTKHILIAIIDAEHKTAEYFEDGTYLVCRTTNVRDGVLKLDGGKYTNQETYLEWIKRGVPEPGDILFTREAPAGEACIVPDEPVLCLGQRMVLFKLNKSIVDSQFVLYSIYSGLADDFIKQLSQGSTVSHMNMADIINIPLFEISLAEQKEIVKYLDRVLSQYDELQKKAELTVELIQERRTALISAAVTGKIDVRDWVAPPASPTHKEVAA